MSLQPRPSRAAPGARSKSRACSLSWVAAAPGAGPRPWACSLCVVSAVPGVRQKSYFAASAPTVHTVHELELQWRKRRCTHNDLQQPLEQEKVRKNRPIHLWFLNCYYADGTCKNKSRGNMHCIVACSVELKLYLGLSAKNITITYMLKTHNWYIFLMTYQIVNVSWLVH
jgi:hypothetical protein